MHSLHQQRILYYNNKNEKHKINNELFIEWMKSGCFFGHKNCCGVFCNQHKKKQYVKLKNAALSVVGGRWSPCVPNAYIAHVCVPMCIMCAYECMCVCMIVTNW